MAYALTNALLIDGVSAQPAPESTVLVEEGKVKAVLSAGEEFGSEYEVLDLDGRPLLPGFIDLHIHVGSLTGSNSWMKNAYFTASRTAVLAAKRARQALLGGVTTLRDLGTQHGVSLALKESVELGQVEGSRIVAAGSIIVMTGGHAYQMACEADGPDAIRQAIRQNLKDGADLIKICQSEGLPYPEYTAEELAVVVEESHLRGKKVACHVETEPGLRMAVEAGVDTIEHGFNPSDETLELMAEKGTYWVPTITINRRMRQEEHDPESYVRAVRGAFASKGMAGSAVEEKLDLLVECFGEFPGRFERGLELGVRIVTGSDGPRPAGYAGELGIPMDSVRNEIVKFVDWGMEPMQALKAATSEAAGAMGLDDRLGRVEPGYYADLVVLGSDPLEDIEAVDEIELVMKKGEVFRNDLNAAG